jgi:hypothetical protein
VTVVLGIGLAVVGCVVLVFNRQIGGPPSLTAPERGTPEYAARNAVSRVAGILIATGLVVAGILFACGVIG